MNFECSGNISGITDRLEKAVHEDRVSHAYIFEGPADVDKKAFAKSFLKGILCPNHRGENCGRCSICDKIDHDNHEDVTYIEKDGSSVRDGAVESVQEKLSVKPLGDRNAVVISDCDTMTARAQNRLLKTLEEPPGNSIIILLSENMENFTQTVLSRCVKFRIDSRGETVNEGKADVVVKMALEGRSFYEIRNEVSEFLKDREKTEMLLDSMERVYRDHIDMKSAEVPKYTFEEICDSIWYIEDARKQIRQGMSPNYALKRLILKISS